MLHPEVPQMWPNYNTTIALHAIDSLTFLQKAVKCIALAGPQASMGLLRQVSVQKAIKDGVNMPAGLCRPAAHDGHDPLLAEHWRSSRRPPQPPVRHVLVGLELQCRHGSTCWRQTLVQ